VTEPRPRFNAIDRLVRRLRLKPIRRWVHQGDVVVDIGCGTENWIIRNLPECGPGSVGVDPYLPHQLEGAQGVRGEVSAVASTRPGEFDVALNLAVIEHLDPRDGAAMLTQIRQLLRPGGRLLLTTPAPRSRWLLELLAFRLHLISEHEIRDHKQYYSLPELNILLADAELHVEHARSFQFGLNQFVVAVRQHGDIS
jgi:SAM-dependent methyltransferase